MNIDIYLQQNRLFVCPKHERPWARESSEINWKHQSQITVLSQLSSFSGLGIRSSDLRSFRYFRSLNRFRRFVKMIDSIFFKKESIFRSFDHKKRSLMFLTVFHLFMSKDRIALVNLRSPIFFKDRRDRFDLVDLWKRSTDLSITKKRSIQSKNRWSNSQPWYFLWVGPFFPQTTSVKVG